MSEQNKIARDVAVGDVVDSVHGPCRVESTKVVDGFVVIGFIVESSGLDWGDVFPPNSPFTILSQE